VGASSGTAQPGCLPLKLSGAQVRASPCLSACLPADPQEALEGPLEGPLEAASSACLAEVQAEVQALCENFLYVFKAARRAARAAASARSPSLPLALPLRRRQRRSAGAKSRRSGRLAYSKFHPCRQASLLPLPELSGAGQNPSRPSVIAGQPHPSSCVVHVHAKTTLTEPARPRSWQRSGAGTRVTRISR
jgi:hypothetical protein